LPNYEEFRQVFSDWQDRMKQPEKKEESIPEAQ